MDILAKYVEIILKGKNRGFFERILRQNIEAFLAHELISYDRLILSGGRVLIENASRLPELHKVMGIDFYSPVATFGYDLEAVENYLRSELADRLRGAKSFRITAKRSDRSFPLTSMDLQKRLGALVHDEFGVPVNLKHPEIEIFVEVANGRIWVYTDAYRGFGGLPVGSSGKLVALLSGGIDSPVASFLMMRRGAELILLHIEIEGEDISVVHRIHEKLSEYARGREPELIILKRQEIWPIEPSMLREWGLERYTCVVCKHYMLKAAEKIAFDYGADGIVTGDSLGQVASQTLENLRAYRRGIELPIYSPLIGFNKTETIEWARRIGTYDISISHKEMPQCAPKRPVTRVSPDKFDEILRRIEG